MSSYATTRYVLVCDGCKTELGAPEGHGTALEMRAAGYASGWRYPARRRVDGSASKQASDVCPECLPTWEVQAAQNSWPRPARADAWEQQQGDRP